MKSGIIRGGLAVESQPVQSVQRMDPKKYIIDYGKKAVNGELVRLVGRKEEVTRVIQTLIRNMKNNPLLVSPSGTGKTALVEGIAKVLTSDHNYSALKGKNMVSLDMAKMLSDSRDEGEYVNLFKQTLDYLIKDKKSILFINDISTLVKMKGYDENHSIANYMKMKFVTQDIRCIIISDVMNFKNYIEPDLQVMRHIQLIQLDPLGVKESYNILLDVKERYEKHYNVRLSDEVLKAVVNLGFRYVKNRYFPDKALDILDDTCAMMQIKGKDRVTIESVCAVVSSWTGIPLEKLDAEDKDRLVRMENILKERVKGQDEAVSVVSEGLRRARSGLQDPNRPIASFLFIGTTGVGKTELAKALAEFMFADETALLRLDMSEFMERANITRMLGPPPGTPGYEQGGMLTESVRLKPYQVVLFDELEKAHPDILNILLQLLDEGRLTDSRGVTVDFRNTIIIMTSNIGSNVPRYQRMEVLGRTLRPEFLNRIDDIVTFGQLGEEDMLGVVGIQLRKLLLRANEQKIKLEFSSRLKKWLVAEVYASKYGVRVLKRLIQHEVENKLAWALLTGMVKEEENLLVDMDDKEREIILKKDRKEMILNMPTWQDKKLVDVDAANKSVAWNPSKGDHPQDKAPAGQEKADKEKEKKTVEASVIPQEDQSLAKAPTPPVQQAIPATAQNPILPSKEPGIQLPRAPSIPSTKQ